MAEEGTLHDAFVDELRDAYDMEKQLTKALPKLAAAAMSAELRTAFEAHLEETRDHVARLEKSFEALGESPRGKTCAGIAGIIKEGSDMLEGGYCDEAMDAVIIAAAQRAEHYEISVYGTLIAWARAMGYDETVTLFQQNLDEEKAADQKLTALAEGGINAEASELGQLDDDENESVEPQDDPSSRRAK